MLLISLFLYLLRRQKVFKMVSTMLSDFQQCLPTSSSNCYSGQSHQLPFLMVCSLLQTHCSLWELIAVSIAIFYEFEFSLNFVFELYFSLWKLNIWHRISLTGSLGLLPNPDSHFLISESNQYHQHFDRATFNKAPKSFKYENLSSHFKTKFQALMIVE